jgi:hypothetical protein
MTDIREAAARAAREWRLKLKHPADPFHAPGEAAYQIGYEAGYEAAKAEAFECPGDTRTCPAFVRGDCKGTEAEWNDESCESRVKP